MARKPAAKSATTTRGIVARKVAKATRAVATAATLAGAMIVTNSVAMDNDPTAFLKQTEQVELPADIAPAALLPYQQKWIADDAQLKIAEKSRRVGLTWAEAADNVSIAAAEGGSNVFYISATQDMAREYIEACAMWAKVFDFAAGEIGESVYEDGENGDGSKRYIKTFEIVFPKSGKRITALSSRPTNLRGKQGVVVIDEAAFHQKLGELLKAAMAMLLWGDKVRIISTHDGVENAFNQLIQEVRAGKRGTATVHRITFREAVNDGLYRRVCMRRGIEWTAANEAKWVEEAYAFYGESASEELDAIPSNTAGSYLPLTLIAQRMTKVPPPTGPVIVRSRWEDSFAYQPEAVRDFAIKGWLLEQIKPHLDALHRDRRHVFGLDFARNQDLSVITIQQEDGAGMHPVKIVIELSNCPFTCQEQILFFIVDALPRFRGGSMDATGNGAALAEKAAQRYGTQMIEQVKLSEKFYLEHMPKLKAGLQDGSVYDIPQDEQLQNDLRAIKLVNGIPKVPNGATQSAGARAMAAEGGGKVRRHGDFAISLFLSEYTWYREAGEIAWTPIPTKAERFEGDADNDDFGGQMGETGTW